MGLCIRRSGSGVTAREGGIASGCAVQVCAVFVCRTPESWDDSQVEDRTPGGMTVARGGPFSSFTMSDFRAPGGPIRIRKCFSAFRFTCLIGSCSFVENAVSGKPYCMLLFNQ